MRSSFFWGLVFLFALFSHVGNAHAQSSVVIGEVGWAGSETSTADEWLELWNMGDVSISLDGYTLVGAGGATGISVSGHTIAPRSAFLIANYTNADTKSTLNAQPDLVTTAVSLPNDKSLIKLIDGNGATIDVAGDGDAPFAGASLPKKISMVRVDTAPDGGMKTSWKSAETSSGFDANATELGTPGTCDGCTRNTVPQEPTPEPTPEPVPEQIPAPEPALIEQIPVAEATTSTQEATSTSDVIAVPDVVTTSSTEATTTEETIIPTATSTEITTVEEAATTTVATTTVTTSTIEATPVEVAAPTPPPVVIPPVTTTVTNPTPPSPPSASGGTPTNTPIKKAASKKSAPKKETPQKEAPPKTAPLKMPAPQQVAPKPIRISSTSTSMQPTKKKAAPRAQKPAASTTVRVQLIGTVLTPKHWLETSFILQAPDGKGLMVNLGSYHSQPPVGAQVRITGTLKHLAKGTTLTVGARDGWVILNTHSSTTTSTVDLLAPGEEDQWRLIELQGVVSRVRAKTIDLDVQDTTISVRLRASVNYRLERLHPGDTVRVLGVIDTSGYEPILYPRTPEDITVLAIAQKTAGTAAAPVGSNLPPWTPFGVAGATVALSEGWRRVHKRYEEYKIRKLLNDDQQFFIS